MLLVNVNLSLIKILTFPTILAMFIMVPLVILCSTIALDVICDIKNVPCEEKCPRLYNFDKNACLLHEGGGREGLRRVYCEIVLDLSHVTDLQEL